jgi:two-component system OmpR family response regulator
LGLVLVIEDDPQTAREIVASLSAAGYEAEVRSDGVSGLEFATQTRFDAITLDRMLPGLEGLEVVRALREAGSDTPILMVSALGDVDDRIDGLRAGGDDYIIKPFAPAELVARIEVLLRRRQRSAAEVRLQVGDLELDLVRHEARRGSHHVELLPMEFKLLEYMMRNAGQLLTRRMIFEAVWEYYFDPGTNLINVHVGKLRRKIDLPGMRQLFRTERGQGYMLNAS